MSAAQLRVSLYGRPCGTLARDGQGFLAFAYDAAWLADAPHPLSQRLPLRDTPFGEAECLPYFAGLLPDNTRIREQLAELFDVPGGDDFALLANIGRDCAGSVSLVPADAPPEPLREGWLEELSEARLAQMIRDLPERPLFVQDGEVQLSLAGVHDKAALYVDDSGRAFLPHKGHPSSHILKVDIRGLPDSIRVEHFCLRLAHRMGLKAAHARLRRAEEQFYLLVMRYDRVVENHGDGERRIRRLHQEDFCQALGVLPGRKYEHQGGPGVADMFRLVRQAAAVPARAIPRLTDYVLFNFLIGNPDSHAKNYSLVYEGRGIEMAPIYDLNNQAAFREHFKVQRPRLAQAIAGERDPTAITPDHWRRFAAEVGVSPVQVLKRLDALAEQMPDTALALRQELAGTEADSPRLDAALEDIIQRCLRVCQEIRQARAPAAT